MSAYTSATLLDLAAILSFIAFLWGTWALSWRLMVTVMDFCLDEIDLYYDRKYPPIYVRPDWVYGRLAYLDRAMLFSRLSREQYYEK